MEKWSGRTAVVTGAGAGIGAAVAVQLANAGFNVVGLDRRGVCADDIKLSGTGTITFKVCDIASSEEVAGTFQWVKQEFGGTDLLVNNAGLCFEGHITEAGSKPLTEEELMSQIDVNFKGVVRCSRHAVACMRERGFDGHVVNINSIAGHYVPAWPQFNVYPATKHAVTAFSRAFINELIECGSRIKVTSISPGLVQTQMLDSSEHEGIKDMPGLLPNDIAEAVIYVITTPKHVQITELTIEPLLSPRL